MGNDELELTEQELDNYVEALDIAEEIWEKDKRRKMEIIFYSTHCPICKGVEMLLKSRKIPYKEVNDREEMIKIGLTSSPALSVNGEIKVGKEINEFIKSYKG